MALTLKEDEEQRCWLSHREIAKVMGRLSLTWREDEEQKRWDGDNGVGVKRINQIRKGGTKALKLRKYQGWVYH